MGVVSNFNIGLAGDGECGTRVLHFNISGSTFLHEENAFEEMQSN